MNRRSAIKALGLLAGAILAVPRLLGAWDHDKQADHYGNPGLKKGDIITNPRTGEKMVVTWVSSESPIIHVSRGGDMTFEAAGDRLLA